MKIEIEEKGSNNYYDEFLYIINNYKKIQNNKNIKIKKLSSISYLYLIISLIILIIYSILYISDKTKMNLIIMIIFIILTIFSIFYIYLVKKNIKTLSNNFVPTKIEISSNYVKIDNAKKNISLNWDEIKYILIGSYTISFIPNNNKEFITTRIDYKDKITAALKKYDKEHLLKKGK